MTEGFVRLQSCSGGAMFENTYPPGLAPLGHPPLGKGGAWLPLSKGPWGCRGASRASAVTGGVYVHVNQRAYNPSAPVCALGHLPLHRGGQGERPQQNPSGLASLGHLPFQGRTSGADTATAPSRLTGSPRHLPFQGRTSGAPRARRMTEEGEGSLPQPRSSDVLPLLSASLTSSPAGGGTEVSQKQRRILYTKSPRL